MADEVTEPLLTDDSNPSANTDAIALDWTDVTCGKHPIVAPGIIAGAPVSNVPVVLLLIAVVTAGSLVPPGLVGRTTGGGITPHGPPHGNKKVKEKVPPKVKIETKNYSKETPLETHN